MKENLKMFFAEDVFEKRREVVVELFRQNRRSVALGDMIAFVGVFANEDLSVFQEKALNGNGCYTVLRQEFFKEYIPEVKKKSSAERRAERINAFVAKYQK